ncbi:MAG: TetR/AcrR family transcriptional regulator [Erythrobacter sp.]
MEKDNKILQAKAERKVAKRGRPAGRTAEQTRAKIIQAAESEFNSRSYPDVSMQQIAKRAGISGPAIYNHFPSKDELFLAAIKLRVLTYNQVITAAVAEGATWQDKLNNLLDAVRPLQGSASGFQTISGAVMNRLRDDPVKFAELRKLREESTVVFRGLVKEAVTSGDLRADLDIAIAGDLLMAMTVGAINTASFYHPEESDMKNIIYAFKVLLGTKSN